MLGAVNHVALTTQVGEGRSKFGLCPIREVTPQVGIPGPNSSLHRGLIQWHGVSAWMHLANTKGCCLPLCGPDTDQ